MIAFTLLIVSLFSLSNGNWDPYIPEQVHLALGFSSAEMTVNWVTFDNPIVTTSLVKYGESITKLDSNATGTTHKFTDSGSDKTVRTIHVATMKNLKASTRYFYQVGDPKYEYSSVFSFKTPPDASTLASSLPHKFVIYGDLGHVNPQTLSHVTEEGLSGNIDMILHVGDFAYDFHDEQGTRGDKFMRDIAPVASAVPYMVSLGNHESAYNFSHYTERFRGMPTTTGTVRTANGEAPNNWYYSWNVGLVHFVAISTEIYFDFPFMIQDQLTWLKKDLAIANKNRTLAPWVVVHGHKPLYCSCDTDCDAAATKVRDGPLGLENVFHEYGVDLYLCGHEHDYERMYDVYQNKTTQSTKQMKATTYIVTGAAGSQEDHEPFRRPQPSRSAFRSNNYGYSRMYVYNASHIHWQQVMCDDGVPNEEGKVIDDVWLIQDTHPFARGSHFKSRVGGSSVTYDVFDHGYVPQYGVVHKHEEEVVVPYLGNDKLLYCNFSNVFC